MEEKKESKLQPASQIRIEPPKEFTIKKEDARLRTGNVADVQPTIQIEPVAADVSSGGGPVVEGVVSAAPETGAVVKQAPGLGVVQQILLVLSIIFILLSGWILLSQALHLPVPGLSK